MNFPLCFIQRPVFGALLFMSCFSSSAMAQGNSVERVHVQQAKSPGATFVTSVNAMKEMTTEEREQFLLGRIEKLERRLAELEERTSIRSTQVTNDISAGLSAAPISSAPSRSPAPAELKAAEPFAFADFKGGGVALEAQQAVVRRVVEFVEVIHETPVVLGRRLHAVDGGDGIHWKWQ